MTRTLLLASVFLGLAGCTVPVAVPVAAAPSAPSLAERLVMDEQRINEGLHFGQFTPPEYNELKGRHAAIEGTRREQLAQGGGRFAPGQYEQLLGYADRPLEHGGFGSSPNRAAMKA